MSAWRVLFFWPWAACWSGSSDGGAGKFTVADGKTLTVSSEIRLSDSNNIASSLEKLGPGNMVLTKDAKLTGAQPGSKVKVTAGKLTVTQGANLGTAPIELSGTTLELSNTGSGASNFVPDHHGKSFRL